VTEPKPPISPPTAPSPSSPLPPPTDWVFLELVDLVNRSTVELPVTLVVQGAIVTGKLIGSHSFYQEYGNLWYQLITRALEESSEVADSVKERWTELGKRALEQTKSEEEFQPPVHVHLKGARYVVGQGLPVPTGGAAFLWRGRISEVSAFSIGELGS
jgi:hypothetical protein